MIGEATARLRRIAAAMRAGRPIPPDDALPLAEAIDGALAGKTDLDAALGLVAPSALSPAAVAQRTELIRKLSRYYSGTTSGRAKAMAFDANRYAGTCWQRLRTADKPPRHHIGKPEVILFELHRNAEMGGAVWPLEWRSLVECLQSRALAAANISVAEAVND